MSACLTDLQQALLCGLVFSLAYFLGMGRRVDGATLRTALRRLRRIKKEEAALWGQPYDPPIPRKGGNA
jgi:hypothetical protein